MRKQYHFSVPVVAGVLVFLSLMFGNGNYDTGRLAHAEEGATSVHVPTSPIEPSFAMPSSTGPLPVEGQPWSSSGWFNIVWGDGREGATETIYTLTDDGGQTIRLLLDETLSRSAGGVMSFDRKRVNVAGVWATSRIAQGATTATTATTNLQVTSISLALSPATGALIAEVSPAVTGAKPWVTIMCKFSDYPAVEPKDLAYFTGMYASTYPGLDHYWRQLSYDTANVTGSNAYGWFTLPNPEIYYNPSNTAGGTDIYKLADECIAAADAPRWIFRFIWASI